VSAVVTPPMIALLLTRYGVPAVFLFVFAILAVVAILMALFGVETRNRSLEEINNDYLVA
jgi:putative MFS transporter